MKYTIGDKVWIAKFEATEARITCADCGGTKVMRVVLFDGTEHTIECAGCSTGFVGPRGYNTFWERIPSARSTIILGVEMEQDRVEYKTRDQYRVPEDQVFLDVGSALRRARELAAEHNEREHNRVKTKENPSRSWAWNVHYHRAEIRRAEKSIAYHTAKLNAARVHKKEADAAASRKET
jgi:ribosomal protein S27E